MANYDGINQIAGNLGFQGRIKCAMMSAAISVYNESSTSSGHIPRVVYAVNVINGNYNIAQATLAVLMNATIASEANTTPPDFSIPDSDIQFAVNSLWNALAGA